MRQLLTEEIVPKLDALRNEKRAFLAFQKATSELERLLRLVKANEWLEASRREAKSGEMLETKQASLKEKKQLLVWLGDKQSKMEKEMGEILKKKEKVGHVPLSREILDVEEGYADKLSFVPIRKWRKEES